MLKRAINVVFFTLFFCVILPFSAFASTDLLFTPASGAYNVDEPFSVRILTQSTEKLSAIEATVSFDPKLLSVNIEKSSTDVSWIITPTVDQEKGEIRFSGMVSNSAPLEIELLQLSVTGLRSGNQELRFVSGASTIAADGSGGNTLGKVTNGSFDIVVEGETPKGEVLGAADSVLSITSPQIQNEEAWYSFTDVILNWTLPKGITDVLVGLTKKKDDIGYKSISSGTTTRTITELENGEWYFHLTPKGMSLSDTVHFRIGIDNEAPQISTTTEKERLDKKDPNITYIIEATDKTSGVSHFEISQSNNPSVRWEDDGTHEYKFRSAGLGEQELTIAAFDKANNRSESHVRFFVEALDEIQIKLKRQKVPEASPIIAELKGLPNAVAVVTFEGGTVHHEDVLNLDNNGNATYILKESVLPGNYQLFAIQRLENGASSKGNNKIDIEVSPSIIGYIGRNLAVSIVVIPIVLIVIIYLVWRFWFIPFYIRKKMRERAIQKVAPLSLMEPSRETKRTSNRPVKTAPLEIRRVVRHQNPNSVIDLRRR